MTENAAPKPPVSAISAIGSVGAPIVFFDDASAVGHSDGVVKVTLECSRIYPDLGEGIIVERVATAHLRMGVNAAISLRDAIDKALLLMQPTQNAQKN